MRDSVFMSILGETKWNAYCVHEIRKERSRNTKTVNKIFESREKMTSQQIGKCNENKQRAWSSFGKEKSISALANVS